MKKLTVIILFSLIFFSSCISVRLPKMSITGKQTVVERQVVGKYREIEPDAWAISSVQTNVQKEQGAAGSSVGDPEMFEAMKIREYHFDKIREYKNEGAIGEANTGYIAYRPLEKYEKDKEQFKLLEILIEEENKARKTIFTRSIVLSGKPKPTPYEVQVFGQKFAEEQLKTALENDIVQNKSGNWFNKQ